MTYALSPEDIIRCRKINLANKELVRMIAKAISAKTGTGIPAILGTSPARPAIAARHLVMYLARKEGLSYPAIGRAMNKDHTTVMHGVKAEMKRRGELPGITQ